VGDYIAAIFAQGSAAFASTSGTTVDLDTTAGGDIAQATLYDAGGRDRHSYRRVGRRHHRI